MRGIAGEKRSSFLVALRHHTVAGPWTQRKQFKRYLITQGSAKFFRRVHCVELLLPDITNVEPPEIFAVHRSTGAI